ncbi:hypothetical protein V502_10622 [Pseudogymnoascus sp. VKM F-4520 (FW-2644)]|nr:hypothetical protein V502_10622 [Pseudogymnoascus sp. VKM F-4520 (FW-2644)]
MVEIKSRGQIAPLVVCSAFIVITIASVILRVAGRRIKKIALQAEDYLIFVALIFVLGLITCDIIGVTHGGVGRHAADIVAEDSPQVLVAFLKDLVAIQMLWATSLMFIKLSILCFYIRIFNVKPFIMASIAVAILVVIWALSVILCGFLLCRPFAYNWDRSIDGSCGDQIKSYIITGALNIVTDALVLGLPMPMIWRLKVNLRSKIALTGIFTIGFFIFIISIIRLKSLVTVSYADITYSVPDALIWSMLEPSLALTLASIPIMRPVFSKIFPDNTQQGSTGNSNPNGSNGVASKNFQLIDEYSLDPMRPDFSENRTYITEGRSRFDDMESQKSSQGQAELVTPNIKVKQEWDVRRT